MSFQTAEVRYAKSGDVHIGDRVFGSGGFDIVFRRLAVVVGSRVAALADEGEVLVSGTVKDLVAGSGIAFEGRGTHELKGLGQWSVYAVTPAPLGSAMATPAP